MTGRRPPPPPRVIGVGGNYVAKVVALARRTGAAVVDIDVAHDPWCALLVRRHACDCEPVVTVGKRGRPPTGGTGGTGSTDGTGGAS